MGRSAFAKEYKKEVEIKDIGKVVIKRLSVDNQELLAKEGNAISPKNLLIASIVSWDFIDTNSNPVVVSPEAIGELSGEVSNPLLQDILKFNTITKEEEKN